MFNNISIDRLDEVGDIIQTIKIPLSYAPRQKFLARIAELPGDDRTREVVVPRMAFEMKDIEYDSSRKTNMVHQNRKIDADAGGALTQYSPVPWNLNMFLYIYAKNQDDALQIVEQILPYFNPDFNLSVKAMPLLNITNDLPIVLRSISFEDTYEGNFQDHRAIFWTIDFTIKLNFYGPLTRTGVIKRVIENIGDYNSGNIRYTYTGTVDPFSAGPEDTYTVIETFEEF